MVLRNVLAILMTLSLAGCAGQQADMTPPPVQAPSESSAEPAPPTAEVKPTRLEKHGHVRVDDYYWLKERENPEVIAYLEAENSYTEGVLAHTEELQETLYEEIVARIQEVDESVPYKKDGYWYYRRFEEGREYPIYCRRKGTMEAEEEVTLDVNQLAEGHDFFSVRGLTVSSAQNILAFGSDSVGRRLYTLQFRDLDTGELLPDVIPNVTGNHAWANDNKTLFYIRQDPETLRWYRIYRHVLGTDPATDQLVYEEPDEQFNLFVFKTKSKRFVLLGSQQTVSTEYRYLDADQPEAEFEVFLPRERDHEYDLDHFGDHFYIRTNWQAKNFRLMSAPIGEAATDKTTWTEVIPHRDNVFLSTFDVFRDHLVVSERKDGLIHMRVKPWDGSADHYLEFGEPAYLAYFGDNPDFDTATLRYGYTSLTTPRSVYDYDMNSREKTLLKRDPVVGDFDPANYVTERLDATARDGVAVPISLVYRRGTRLDGDSPLLLYAYGSYGSSTNARFSSSRLSLLDRGFVYAIAHVRGGQELGRAWYEDGKLTKKMNTFTDFIDCARYLVAEGYTSPDRLFARGGSAGGLLMGAIANLAPEQFKGVVSHVPFVDVITTMLDPDIPLTTSEYDEWGNPNDKAAYDYILSYSPYDNLEAKNYPNMLVTTGLHDSQVQYWEPAKYVAKLRQLKTDDNRLLLKTNMGAGHGGASGRFKKHRETALEYAFLLDLAGISE